MDRQTDRTKLIVAFPNSENARERFCVKIREDVSRWLPMVAQDQRCIQYSGMAKRTARRPLGPTPQVTPLSWMDGWLVGHICRMKSDVHGAGRRPRARNVLRRASVQRFQEEWPSWQPCTLLPQPGSSLIAARYIRSGD